MEASNERMSSGVRPAARRSRVPSRVELLLEVGWGVRVAWWERSWAWASGVMGIHEPSGSSCQPGYSEASSLGEWGGEGEDGGWGWLMSGAAEMGCEDLCADEEDEGPLIGRAELREKKSTGAGSTLLDLVEISANAAACTDRELSARCVFVGCNALLF